MIVPVLLQACCFVFAALATHVQSHRSLENYEQSLESYGVKTENDDFTSENYIVPKNIQLYVSRIVSEIEKKHSSEIKELKAVIESQGRQIKALELDKHILTSVVKKLKRRIDQSEDRKTIQVEDDAGQERKLTASSILADVFSYNKFQKSSSTGKTEIFSRKKNC